MAQLSIEHVKGNTYYIPAPTNIGVYVEENQAILIDSGNDKEAGRQIMRLLNQNSWDLKLIINTHSNADHIGGNAFLQNKTGCGVAATGGEAVFIQDPLMEPCFLYGGFPHQMMRNKFLMAKPSKVTNPINNHGNIGDTELTAFSLPGHFYDMIGIKTPDDICFIADSLFPENIIKKYHLFYLWDIKAHLETLDQMKNLEAELFIPSHGQPVTDIKPLIEINRNKILEIMAGIENTCRQPISTEGVLRMVCDTYGIVLDVNQFVLVSSTVRSYLSYLLEQGKLEYIFEDSALKWKMV